MSKTSGIRWWTQKNTCEITVLSLWYTTLQFKTLWTDFISSVVIQNYSAAAYGLSGCQGANSIVVGLNPTIHNSTVFQAGHLAV